MGGLRVRLIGSGFVAKHKHLPAWQRLGSKAEVVALCDPQVAQADELAKAHRIPTVCAEVQEMRQADRLDVVERLISGIVECIQTGSPCPGTPEEDCMVVKQLAARSS